MDWNILRSKLVIPAPPPGYVPRLRLQTALEDNVALYKVTLVAAPAGYGKSVVLGAWAHASRLPVAWLSLSEDEHDALSFLRYLLTAWSTVAPNVMESSAGLLLGSYAPDVGAALRAFVNAGEELPGEMAFVLDDYQRIVDPAIHAAMDFILDNLPTQMHFVVASRDEPPLALAHYRAHRQLKEFRVDALRFMPGECAEFLNQWPDLSLSPGDQAALQADTEGWIAGLQLAVLAAQRRPAGAEPLRLVSGHQRFIADYLAADVFDRLTDDQQTFLLKTSVLERLCASLCEAVAVKLPGQAMLESLEEANLFIVALDDRREWFRYHQLFAEFLQDMLERRFPEQLADLHQRAGHWHLAHDLPDRAFQHALAAQDASLALLVVEQHFASKLLGGEFGVLKGWLDAIPELWLADYPMLGLFRAGVLLFTGSFEAATRSVDEVEEQLELTRRKDAGWRRARVTALRCFIACFHNDLPLAEGYADEALRNLPESDLSFRADVLHALGDTYRTFGRWDEARANYLSVLDLVQAPAFEIRSTHVFGALADLELRQGRLRNSAVYWRRALALIEAPQTWGRFPLPLAGWVYLRLGEIIYEWNELPAASAYLAQGLARAELGDDVRTTIAGYLLAGRLALSQGNREGAAAYLERARPLVEQAPFADWTSRFERFQVELWLAQNKLAAAVDWAESQPPAGRNAAEPDSEAGQLALGRVLIAKHTRTDREQAITLLGGLLETAGAVGRTGIQIEALALQALAYWQQRDRAGALSALERALRLAEPEGYVRLFVDLGLGLAQLLQEAESRGVRREYVGRLLAACGDDRSRALMPALVEPLSPREQEVLALVAAGLTNREIAEHLFISPETVKKHCTAIYGKLGVKNRTEAAARARELDLLS